MDSSAVDPHRMQNVAFRFPSGRTEILPPRIRIRSRHGPLLLRAGGLDRSSQTTGKVGPPGTPRSSPASSPTIRPLRCQQCPARDHHAPVDPSSSRAGGSAQHEHKPPKIPISGAIPLVSRQRVVGGLIRFLTANRTKVFHVKRFCPIEPSNRTILTNLLLSLS